MNKRSGKMYPFVIGALVLFVLLYGFHINTQYLSIKKHLKINQVFAEMSNKGNKIHQLIATLHTSPEPLIDLYIQDLLVELKLVQELRDRFKALKMDDPEVLDIYEKMTEIPISLIDLHKDNQIAKITISDYHTDYSLINKKNDKQLKLHIIKTNEQLHALLDNTVIYTVGLIGILIVVFLVTYFLFLYPKYLNDKFDLHSNFKIQKNLQQKLDAFKQHADRLIDEKPHQLSEQEFKTAILESREDERLLLVNHLDYLEFLIKHAINGTQYVDYSDFLDLQKNLKSIQEDLDQISKELIRHRFNLLPSEIMSRGLIPSIVLFCNHNNEHVSMQLNFINESKIQTSLDYIHEVNLYRLIVETTEMIIENYFYKLGRCNLTIEKNEWQLIFHFSIENQYIKNRKRTTTMKNLPDRYYHIVKRAALIDVTVTQYTNISQITDVFLVYPLNKHKT